MKFFIFALIGALSSLLEYKFGRDFGEKFYDYSGNLNHGLVGADVPSKPYKTDRGVYFYGGSYNYIKATNQFTLPSSFYIVSWVMPSSLDNLFFSKITDDTCTFINVFLHKKVIFPQEYPLVITDAAASVYAWFLFSLVKSGNEFNMYFNSNQAMIVFSAWNDIQSSLYIGSNKVTDLSFGGFIWSYIINGDSFDLNHFIGSSSTSCLLGSATCTGCSVSVKDEDFGTGCISDESNYTLNTLEESCEFPDYGCSRSIDFNCTIAVNVCAYDPITNTCIEIDLSDGSESLFECQCRTRYVILYSKCEFNTCTKSNSGIVDNVCVCDTGYYGDPSVENCTKCDPGCIECNSTKCLVCQDPSAIVPIKTCECLPAYYMDSNYTCQSCEKSCSACNESSCFACYSENTQIIGNICECQDRHFGDLYLNSSDSCKPCLDECASCENSSSCTECISSNSMLNEFGRCLCLKGFYNDTSLISIDSCKTCNEECSSCENSASCTECVSSNTKLNLLGRCVCMKGYYNDTSLISIDSCKVCNDECAACKDNETCTQCLTVHAKVNEDGKCECRKGFYNESSLTLKKSCLRCDESCETCNSSNTCLTCADERAVLNSKGKCVILCSRFRVSGCIECSELCENCNEDLICSNCSENAELYSLTNCKCKSGFTKVKNSCAQNYFFGNISVKSQNKIKLEFSEPLMFALRHNETQFKVDDLISKFYLKSLSNSAYYLLVNISDLRQEHEFKVTILRNQVLSKKNSALLNYTFTILSYPINNNDGTLTKLQVSMQVTITTSAGMSMLSNPTALWSLLNTIQLITFMPLNAVPYSQRFRKITLTLLNINIVPNLLEYFMDPNSTSEPYEQALEFGVRTSSILLNAGKYIVIILALLLLNLILFFLSRIFAMLKFFERRKRFRFILRFWLVSYLEIMIYAFIQLKAVNYK